LVRLDEEQVMAPLADDLRVEITLAEHGVAGDQAAFQDKSREQPKAGLMFVGLVEDAVGDGPLGERQPRLVGHQREQVYGLAEAVGTATGRLAVDRKRFQRQSVVPTRPAQQGFGPWGQCGLEGGDVQGDEPLTDASKFGRPPREAQTVHQRDVMVGRPLGDRGVTPRPTEDRARHQAEDRRERMLTPGRRSQPIVAFRAC